MSKVNGADEQRAEIQRRSASAEKSLEMPDWGEQTAQACAKVLVTSIVPYRLIDKLSPLPKCERFGTDIQVLTR
jgi:hypothetical protein